ncbi:enoyl-CoA hydratase/isomerase family protein [Paenibacillus polymyxa]|uniref:enoyl-CoA hydratase/isomerase family protein n=2 Tax=Paenibacillus TaxID=44249 RepID=UPI0008FC316C|nr:MULTISPECIES: enoyl-CoA hydratase/isomerase family protein [Paenibacillus]APB72373.1 enoyl-CoA hydratase/isomerase family protein [Paenibacillus polymyxa]OMF47150.1 crotonase [Paenibacillus peoriae]
MAGPTRFEKYSEKYKDLFFMTRRDGILEVRMHTRGGPLQFDWATQTAYGNVWSDVGRDPENEVMILTGTGDLWQIGNPEVWTTKFMDWPNNRKLELYHESLRMIENMIYCIDIPTIGVINGTGSHWQMGTLCDITICAEGTEFFDAHYLGGVPPGDGIVLALQNILGIKKAAFCAYTGMNINAQAALDLGLVSEVLPREKLLPRAWELAEMIMQAPRFVRHLTHSIVSHTWKKALANDQGLQLTHQLYDMAIDEEDVLERLMKIKERFQRNER